MVRTVLEETGYKLKLLDPKTPVYTVDMIKRLDHADLIIPKGAEDTARHYYCEILGMREIEKPEVLRKNGGLWLQLPGSQLHLGFEKKEGVDPRKTKAHLAFEVEDLQALETLLLKNGFQTKKQDQLPGMARMETEDPFGHRIEFLQMCSDDRRSDSISATKSDI